MSMTCDQISTNIYDLCSNIYEYLWPVTKYLRISMTCNQISTKYLRISMTCDVAQVLISPSGRLLADTVSTLGGTPAAAGMLARGVSGSEEATALLLRVARGDIAIAPMQPAPVPPPQVAQPAPVVPVAPVVVAPPVVVAAPVALVAASVVVAPVVSAPVVAGPAQVVAAAPRVAPAASRPPAARGPVVPEKKVIFLFFFYKIVMSTYTSICFIY
ncbi:hypothetical protein T492DRAFT_497477 [Pavlovales sp. CCMP2436]|nr:hypothetical protein T492DRAFT_497477 [Pavlovales sp. CCMP2436]